MTPRPSIRILIVRPAGESASGDHLQFMIKWRSSPFVKPRPRGRGGPVAEKALRADARRNRDAILTAARAAFLAGEDGIRFDDFAVLTGACTRTVYRHFPTREALAAAVFG